MAGSCGQGLEDTVTDPLSKLEREALTRIRLHSDVVNALKQDMEVLRSKHFAEASLVELRKIVSRADHVETLLGVQRDVLKKDLLVAEWPSEELEQGRKVVSAIDTFETSMQKARVQIEDDDGSTPTSVASSLEGLVKAWGSLLQIDRDIRQRQELVVSRVALMIESRGNLISPLLDALLDKAMEIRSGGGSGSRNPAQIAALDKRLHELLRQVQVKQMLEALHVEVPALTPLSEHATGAADNSSSSAAVGLDMTRGGSASGVYRDPIGDSIVTQKQMKAITEDPLLQTVPGASGASNMPVGSVALNRRGGAPAFHGGSPELWRAVHVGDLSAIQHFIRTGGCSAAMRDASGHSVIWHAVAFNHMAIAALMLESFPVDSDTGVDVTETHARKGDTLLHLLCQSRDFSAETANVFKRIAVAAPADILQKTNANGLTFMQIAASTLNFWVVTFALRHFQIVAKRLVCMPNKEPLKNMADVIAAPPPPTNLEPEPLPDFFRASDMLQQDATGSVPYADVAFDVGPDSGRGLATGRFLAHRIIVAMQSPVLFEAFEKLPLTPLPKEGICAAIFRVDPRISKDVWRSALQFMYTGVIACSFQDDAQKVLELLRACVLYKLPQPLNDFAQHRLYHLLPMAAPQLALQVFSICSKTDASEGSTVALEISTSVVLRNAHTLFEPLEPKEMCQTLERLVRTVEQLVFSSQRKPQATAKVSLSGAGGGVQTLGPQRLDETLSLSQSFSQPQPVSGAPGVGMAGYYGGGRALAPDALSHSAAAQQYSIHQMPAHAQQQGYAMPASQAAYANYGGAGAGQW